MTQVIQYSLEFYRQDRSLPVLHSTTQAFSFVLTKNGRNAQPRCLLRTSISDLDEEVTARPNAICLRIKPDLKAQGNTAHADGNDKFKTADSTACLLIKSFVRRSDLITLHASFSQAIARRLARSSQHPAQKTQSARYLTHVKIRRRRCQRSNLALRARSTAPSTGRLRRGGAISPCPALWQASTSRAPEHGQPRTGVAAESATLSQRRDAVHSPPHRRQTWPTDARCDGGPDVSSGPTLGEERPPADGRRHSASHNDGMRLTSRRGERGARGTVCRHARSRPRLDALILRQLSHTPNALATDAWRRHEPFGSAVSLSSTSAWFCAPSREASRHLVIVQAIERASNRARIRSRMPSLRAA